MSEQNVIVERVGNRLEIILNRPERKNAITQQLAAELRERLTRIPEDDLEQQMEALRHFKLAHRLRVAASEIAGSLPLMKVSDYLTWLAEAILDRKSVCRERV